MATKLILREPSTKRQQSACDVARQLHHNLTSQFCLRSLTGYRLSILPELKFGRMGRKTHSGHKKDPPEESQKDQVNDPITESEGTKKISPKKGVKGRSSSALSKDSDGNRQTKGTLVEKSKSKVKEVEISPVNKTPKDGDGSHLERNGSAAKTPTLSKEKSRSPQRSRSRLTEGRGESGKGEKTPSKVAKIIFKETSPSPKKKGVKPKPKTPPKRGKPTTTSKLPKFTESESESSSESDEVTEKEEITSSESLESESEEESRDNKSWKRLKNRNAEHRPRSRSRHSSHDRKSAKQYRRRGDSFSRSRSRSRSQRKRRYLQDESGWSSSDSEAYFKKVLKRVKKEIKREKRSERDRKRKKRSHRRSSSRSSSRSRLRTPKRKKKGKPSVPQPQHSTPKKKADETPNYPSPIKSPSDTSIYAPAIPCDGISPHARTRIAGRQGGAAEAATKVRKQFDDNTEFITNFIKHIRIGSAGRRDRCTPDHDSDRGQGSSSGRVHSEVRVPHKDRGKDEERSQAERAREDAQKMVLQAENYKAELAPEGRSVVNQIKDLLQSKADDEFFHVTCHIDDSVRERIKRGEFVELEKLLLKNRNFQTR